MQIIRHTTAQLATFIPPLGAILIDTDKDAIVVGDGVTVGGIVASPELVSAFTSGTMDGVAIGGNTPAAGVFTTLAANSLNTGEGVYELHDMDQDLKTTDDVFFGSIIETGGVLKQNLITNSQFIGASKGSLENVGSDLITNGNFASGITSWADNSTGDGSFAFDTDHAELDANTGTAEMGQTISSLVVGKVYKISLGIAEAATSVLVTGGSSAYGGTEHFTKTYTSTGTKTIVFRAVGTSLYLEIKNSTDEIVAIDDVTMYEVTSGFVAANAFCFDGWSKDSGADVHREYIGSNTKDGSVFAMKTSGTVGHQIQWPKTSSIESEYKKFENRAVTVGVWCKTGTASHARIGISQNSGTTNSSFHTGGGAYEWLEVTVTGDATLTWFGVKLDRAASGATAYWSQPVLVFGNVIGSGNYIPRLNEEVLFETAITLNSYSGVTAADATIKMEEETNGACGKGCKVYFIEMTGTGNAATDKVVVYESSSKALPWLTLNCDGTNPATVSGWVGADGNGDIYIDDTGSMGTFTIKVLGIKIR